MTRRPAQIIADDPDDLAADADGIVDWELPAWPDAPGTAIDPLTRTIEDWERGRAARAAAINPALNLDRWPENLGKYKRGRRKGTVSKRPSRQENGVIVYQCWRCRQYKPRTEFYAKREDPIGIQGHCKACAKIETAERWRRANGAGESKQAALCEAEQGT